VLVDASSLGSDDALAYDDTAEAALEVLTLPVVGEVTARASRSFNKYT